MNALLVNDVGNVDILWFVVLTFTVSFLRHLLYILGTMQ